MYLLSFSGCSTWKLDCYGFKWALSRTNCGDLAWKGKHPLKEFEKGTKQNKEAYEITVGRFINQKQRQKYNSDLFVPSGVNNALEGFLEQVVEQYVNNWYEVGISRDRAFLNEIK